MKLLTDRQVASAYFLAKNDPIEFEKKYEVKFSLDLLRQLETRYLEVKPKLDAEDARHAQIRAKRNADREQMFIDKADRIETMKRHFRFNQKSNKILCIIAGLIMLAYWACCYGSAPIEDYVGRGVSIAIICIMSILILRVVIKEAAADNRDKTNCYKSDDDYLRRKAEIEMEGYDYYCWTHKGLCFSMTGSKQFFIVYACFDIIHSLAMTLYLITLVMAICKTQVGCGYTLALGYGVVYFTMFHKKWLNDKYTRYALANKVWGLLIKLGYTLLLLVMTGCIIGAAAQNGVKLF